MFFYQAFNLILIETSNKKPILFTNYFLLPFKSNEKIAIFPLFKKTGNKSATRTTYVFCNMAISFSHFSLVECTNNGLIMTKCVLPKIFQTLKP